MILSYAQTFNEKMHEQLVKKSERFLNTLNRRYENKEKKHKSVLFVQKCSTIVKTQQYLHKRPESLQLC